MTGLVEDQDIIRLRAFAIWEKRGKPEGEEMANWEQARREVMAANGNAEEQPEPAPAAPDEELPKAS